MAAFKDKCPQCGREFTNYHDPIAMRRFCSVGCQVRWAMDEPVTDSILCNKSCWAMPDCAKCRKRKAPHGRSVPLPASGMYCDMECGAYYEEPLVGHLWPGEHADKCASHYNEAPCNCPLRSALHAGSTEKP